MDAIFANIAESIANELPNMQKEEERLSEMRRDLWDGEQSLHHRQDAARLLCRALIDSGAADQ